MHEVEPVYDRIGAGYVRYRRADPRIAAAIDRALGPARSVLDVGSGAGSYEPSRRRVVAIEPSTTMISQRPRDSAPVVRGVAEAMPFPDRAFDAALAVLTVQHWSDVQRGVDEMVRVAPRQVVLTSDTEVFSGFWLLTDYLPQLRAHEVGGPDVSTVVEMLGGARVIPVLIPWDCVDGFCGAYWLRPASYLDPGARAAISHLARGDPAVVHDAMEHLAHDLATGAWTRRHGHLLAQQSVDLGYRLLVADGGHDRGGIEHRGATAWVR